MGTKNTNLYIHLSKIPKKDFKKFEDFLLSPFFKTKKWQIELWQILKEDYPSFNKKSKQEIWTQSSHFNQKAFNNQRINEYFAEMNKMVQQFLQMLTLSKDESFQQQLVLNTATQFDLPKWYTSNVLKEDQNFENISFFKQEDYQRIIKRYNEILRNPHIGKHFIHSNISKLYDEAVNHYFIIEKLQQALPIISRNKRQGGETNVHLLDETLSYIRTQNIKHPLIELYAKLIHLYENWDLQKYKDTISLYFSIVQYLSQTEQFALILHFSNLIAKRISIDSTDLHQLQFSLFKNGVANGVFQHPARITVRSFGNICNSAAIAQQSEWTFQFIQTHLQYLPLHQQAASEALAKARVAFHTQQFDTAANILLSTKSKDFLIMLNIRTMAVRCLLYNFIKNKNNLRTLYAEIHAFLRYIQRSNKVNAERKRSYSNMLRIAKKIAKICSDNKVNVKKKTELKQQIQQKEIMVARDWMLKILDEV